jgi:hypothetical protein
MNPRNILIIILRYAAGHPFGAPLRGRCHFVDFEFVTTQNTVLA